MEKFILRDYQKAAVKAGLEIIKSKKNNHNKKH